jgi:adenine-specific DNA methylase
LADAIWGAGFTVVNSQPVKAEMSVATPKAQAKEPIQLDIVIVCRKQAANTDTISPKAAIDTAQTKLARLALAGFVLSRNDRKIVLYGQMLTTLKSTSDLSAATTYVDAALEHPWPEQRKRVRLIEQPLLFGEA